MQIIGAELWLELEQEREREQQQEAEVNAVTGLKIKNLNFDHVFNYVESTCI